LKAFLNRSYNSEDVAELQKNRAILLCDYLRCGIIDDVARDPLPQRVGLSAYQDWQVLIVLRLKRPACCRTSDVARSLGTKASSTRHALGIGAQCSLRRGSVTPTML